MSKSEESSNAGSSFTVMYFMCAAVVVCMFKSLCSALLQVVGWLYLLQTTVGHVMMLMLPQKIQQLLSATMLNCSPNSNVLLQLGECTTAAGPDSGDCILNQVLLIQITISIAEYAL